MTHVRLSLICLLGLPAFAQAAPPPHIVARASESSGALGGTSLTLWSDGYAEFVSSRGTGEHRSGQVPKKTLTKLVASLKATGLTKEHYTQRAKHPIIQHGFSRLEIHNGTKLHSLQQPALGKANAATKALTARVGKAANLLREAVQPHLNTQGPNGRYARVHILGKATDASRRETPAQLTPAFKRAFARPGSYVLLPAAESKAIKHGAYGVVEGREVVWILRDIKARKKATKKR